MQSFNRASFSRCNISHMFVLFNLLLLSYHPSAKAQCVGPLRDGSFEEATKGTVNKSKWVKEGIAGIDINAGLSFRGRNNAWVRNTTGWNAIRQAVQLSEGVSYTLRAFIRTSGNVRDGYFGFRDAGQHPVSEIKFGQSPVYRQLTVRFKPARTGRYYIFAGLWAPNQDAWIQVDEVTVSFPCNDVELIPADN